MSAGIPSFCAISSSEHVGSRLKTLISLIAWFPQLLNMVSLLPFIISPHDSILAAI
ncbi:hypothetical protein D3C87_2044990 [compost metagenome]